jgi:hypothetical protein
MGSPNFEFSAGIKNRRPKIYGGSAFQQAIDEGLITEMVKK